jgi:hypothetical protein
MNALEYKFAVIDINLFGCSTKDGPVPRKGHRDCYSLTIAFYLVYQGFRKWGSVSIDTVGEGLGFWLQGNVSDLLYWEVGKINALRRCCSGKVTFSFDFQFMGSFYELIWDSELACGDDDLDAVWHLPKCRYDEDDISSIRER